MTEKKQKYSNNPVWVDLKLNRVLTEQETKIVKQLPKRKRKARYHCFPSVHEFKVWQILETKIPNNCEIILQYPIALIKKSLAYPNGKTWKVDFAIVRKGKNIERPLQLVEAKGYEAESFIANLTLLEQFQTELFHKLTIVYPKYRLPKTGMIHRLNHNPNWQGMAITLEQLPFWEFIY